jgi:hypothetical protein
MIANAPSPTMLPPDLVSSINTISSVVESVAHVEAAASRGVVLDLLISLPDVIHEGLLRMRQGEVDRRKAFAT